MQGRKKIKNFAVHLALICISFIIAFPFLWMFTNSIKTKDEIWAVPICGEIMRMLWQMEPFYDICGTVPTRRLLLP